jgi:hypothetical protein
MTLNAAIQWLSPLETCAADFNSLVDQPIWVLGMQ